ncbi:MAG: glycerophosphodiester phosphodiesterase family protein [Candidatus Izemoplasmatales bacterium]|nr:glycerophosphodiester phosphodiesterase family protein [Candidatus Izemoplasmatales bacterium]
MRKKRWLVIVLGLILTYLNLALLPRFPNVSQENPLLVHDGLPRLIAHGGGNHEFPDNTLEAFYHAFSIDENVIMETDVSMTLDGVIILSHDTTLDRKTTLVNAPIHLTNYTDLLDDEVDFGYHNPVQSGVNTSETFEKYQNYLGFEVTPLDVTYPEGILPRHPSKFLVTTLRELIIAFPNNVINVEIKQSGALGLDALAQVIEIMDELDAEYHTYERIVLASFHDEVFDHLKSIKKESHADLMISPSVKTVIRYVILQTMFLDFFFWDPIHVIQVPVEQSSITLATFRMVRSAHRHNIAVHYWTIDDPDMMLQLIELGADGIMTNRPSVLKAILDSLDSDA